MAAPEHVVPASEHDSPAVNFDELSRSYPPLTPHISQTKEGSITIDFKNPIAQRRLTEAILHRDFGLSLVLPDDRLCPPVPNRLTYVQWISDIVSLDRRPELSPVRGIDIGTGASAIYVLLACALHREWVVIGTDVDDQSLTFAQDNVRRNNFESRAEIRKVDPSGPILEPLLSADSPNFDFTMCNPPFYSSREEVDQLAARKELAPIAVCTGSANEMITPGGEVNFITRMVRESMGHGTRCRWYTSLIGKLSSVREIVQLLRRENIDNYGLKEILQGQTKRWAVVWSFDDIRLPDTLARPSSFAVRALVPLSTRFEFQLPAHVSDAHGLHIELIQQIAGLEIVAGAPGEIIVSARRNTWSRAARRNKSTPESHDSTSATLPILLKCRVSVRSNEGRVLIVEWLRGKDRALYESFWNHLKRKLEDQFRQLDVDVEMS